jgi:hypothetical protein
MRRIRRSFGLLALVCLLGFVLEIGGVELARAGEVIRGSSSTAPPAAAQAYQAGPREGRESDGMRALPPGAAELLGLSVLAAILYGFRVSGLARTARATHAIRSPTFARGLRARR